METVRSLIDRDAVVASGGRYVWAPGANVDLAALAAPTSLQTLVAARLDALAPDERRLVQQAAVLGLEFTADGAAAVARTSTDAVLALLDRLVHRDVLERATAFRTGADVGYRFTQAITRQVAYQTLARRDRHAHHLTAAEHLSGTDDHALAGIAAEHYLDALASAPAGADPAPLRDRARELLTLAATRAEQVASPIQAHALVLRALGLDGTGEQQARLLDQASRTGPAAGQRADAEQLAGRAAAAWTALERPLEAARSTTQQGRLRTHGGDYDGALALLLPLLERQRDRADPPVDVLSDRAQRRGRPSPQRPDGRVVHAQPEPLRPRGAGR